MPAVVRTLALLPLTRDGVEDRVAVALADNPFLRRTARRACRTCGASSRDGVCAACARTTAAPTVDMAWSAGGRDPVHWLCDDLVVLARCAAPAGCADVVELVVDHLDARGVLDDDPAGIAALHGLPVAVVEGAVDAVRAVGPAGVARPTIAECLAEQAREVVVRGEAPAWFVVLVRDHLDAVAASDPAAPAAELGLPLGDVKAAFDLVRTALHPPLYAPRTRAREAVPVAPDVFVDLMDGALVVRVVDSAGLGLALVPVHRSVATDVDAARWAAAHRADARLLLRQLDARADVLLRVAQCAVERQSAFVLQGPAAHVPLSRAEVAAGTGLHPSTVSRAVRHAVMRYPDGRTSALAALFGGATAVQDLIVRLLEEQPMSDARLRDRLAGHGFDLARRTVAKHRALLGLPAGGHRR